MPHLSKRFRFQHLSLLLILIVVIVAGCRIGGGYGDDESIQATVSLTGSILMPPDAIASLKLNTALSGEQLLAAKLAGYVSAPGAEVWIEELPDFPHEITDKDGKYEFKRLPLGNYHVIASLKKTDGSFIKVRSAEVEIELKNEKASAPELGLAPANKVVTGVLLDAGGNVLPPGTLLTLWGEKFYVGEDGKFTSPFMPDDVDTADIIVALPAAGTASRPVVTVQFLSATEPTTVEIQIAKPGDQPRPFSASLQVQKNGQPVSAENVVNAASRVDLALTLTNIDLIAAGLAIVWDSGRGSFAIDPTNHISAIWVAPAVAGMATISVKISAPDRGSFKVFMPVIVDLAVPAPTHTVSFDAQGGSAVTAQTVESGTQAATPAAPTRIDYTFAGWYKEADCTNIWDFASEKVIANTTVYAKWIAAAATTYTVSFDAQGGSAVTAQTVESGTQAATPAAPTRTGHTFAGWYKEADCTNLWDFASEKVTADTNIYAKWTLNQYTLTYTAGTNGSITGTSPQSVAHAANGTAVTAVPASGYKFVNWSDSLTDNPRTDLNVIASLAVTANFVDMEAKFPGANKYAWSENAGWANFSTDYAKVSAKLGANGYLTGYAWSENLGWIKFAAEAATAPYANNSATSWGVNMNSNGKLSGYAWSENAGWISFTTAFSEVSVNQQTGAMAGYAWSENIGWVKLAGSSYSVQFEL